MATSISGLSILVIDPDEEWRNFTCKTLQSFGIVRVAGCGNSNDALAQVAQGAIDVIFVDSAAAPLDGLSLVKTIRSTNTQDRIAPPIILMMGEEAAENVEDSLSAGANDCLFKPFSAVDLMGHLMSVIERPQPFIRTRTYFGPDRRRRVDPAYGGRERRESSPVEATEGVEDVIAQEPTPKVASKAR